MSVTKFNLPPLPPNMGIVDPATGLATASFAQFWQQAMTAIAAQLNALAVAKEALAAANTAQSTANTAQTTANTAQTTALAADTTAKVPSSYVTTTNILSAADIGSTTRIVVSAHTRVLADGTTLSINSGSVSGVSYGQTLFVYYDDPTLAGGAVTYQTTVDPNVAAQTGTRFCVGLITTPTSGGSPTTGTVAKPPGSGVL